MNANNVFAGGTGLISREDRMEIANGTEEESFSYHVPKGMDPCYLDTSSIYYTDQSTFYSSNYHTHQTYDSTFYVQK